MKGWVILVAAVTGFVGLLVAGAFIWELIAPSVIVIRNVGDQPAQLVLTDADHTTQVWSGRLDPDRRKRVIVWFKDEGSPELRCRDRISSNKAKLSYVTGHAPISADITIAGCNHIDPSLK